MNAYGKAAGWTASGLLVAGLATGVATAVTPFDSGGSTATAGNGTAATTAAADSPAAPARPDATNRPGLRHRLGILRRTVHGEVVLRTKDGFATVDFARGQVTAASPTSIRVRGADGTVQTYTVADATRVRVDGQRSSMSAVTTADRALVVAVRSGATRTARLVVARSPGFRPHAGSGQGSTGQGSTDQGA